MGLLFAGGEGRGQGWVRVAGGHVCIGQQQFSGRERGGAPCFASRKANDADLIQKLHEGLLKQNKSHRMQFASSQGTLQRPWKLGWSVHKRTDA